MRGRGVRGRRWLIPEVVQTSAIDCGPAALKSLLEGFHIPVSYGRLREACQTDVDGTSIDTLEEVALQLGLEAEQVMLPVEHLWLPRAQALPALTITRLPNGSTHFIVLWRLHAGLVQVMDPASGRTFQTPERLLRHLYQHTARVPVAQWREWAVSEGFLRPLEDRLARLGAHAVGRAWLGACVDTPEWRPLAALDAATRMVESLVQSGGLRRGRQAVRALELFWRRAEGQALAVPEVFWSVHPAPPQEEAEPPMLLVTGAVLLCVRGPRASSDRASRPAPPASPELAAALSEPPARPGRELLHLLREEGWTAPALLAAALAVAAGGVLLEALLFRGLFDIGRSLGPLTQRLGWMGMVLLALGALLLLELPLSAGVRRLGRHLEVRLRIAFLEKLPRMEERYFHSRPTSDMAERAHGLHVLRGLPLLVAQGLRTALSLGLTAVGIIWLSPSSAPLVLSVAVLSGVLPLLSQRGLAERELRMRTHSGALGRFYLDALLGLVAVRAHGAERAVRRQHESLLVEWSRAGRSFLGGAVLVEALQSLTALGLSVWIFLGALASQGEASGSLLLLYWALSLPALGQELGVLARQYPAHRNIILRLLEPLGALEEPASAPSDPSVAPRSGERGGAVSIQLEDVSVRAAGHLVLEGISLSIPAGAQVAIVGASGAGKSSLVGVLLGWHRASSGRVLVEGQPLEGQLAALRRRTAWVDPAVQLWNRSLLENLSYGSSEVSGLGSVLADAELHEVLQRLPEGLQTGLGEGGALLSGGEGQRVRLGRALLARHPGLVILDEPFRGLDRERRRELLARARARWRGATLLCITHDVGETRDFERVLVVEGGRVVEDEVPEVLAARAGSRYAAMLEAEQSVRRELWSSEAWRRLQLAQGRLSERS